MRLGSSNQAPYNHNRPQVGFHHGKRSTLTSANCGVGVSCQNAHVPVHGGRKNNGTNPNILRACYRPTFVIHISTRRAFRSNNSGNATITKSLMAKVVYLFG